MFEPRVMCFFCKWCTYAGADLAGTSRKQYPPNGVAVRVSLSAIVRIVDPYKALTGFGGEEDPVPVHVDAHVLHVVDRLQDTVPVDVLAFLCVRLEDREDQVLFSGPRDTLDVH